MTIAPAATKSISEVAVENVGLRGGDGAGSSSFDVASFESESGGETESPSGFGIASFDEDQPKGAMAS
jgi:hypothetical protein